MRSQIVSFLAGLTAAGLYAGFSLKNDLSTFHESISKLNTSVDDVGKQIKKVRDLEEELERIKRSDQNIQQRLRNLEKNQNN